MLHSIAAQADAGATVRLSFPQGVHPDVTVQPGELTIGSAPDNSVVLKVDGIQPHHASLVVDNRGYTLFVRAPEAQTHVNARPVREKAILRLGDIVSLEAINVVLKPNYDETVTQNKPGPVASGDGQTNRVSPPRAVLRGVAGEYFGKVIPIHGKLSLGNGSGCDLVLDEPGIADKHATIEINGTMIVLRDHGSASGTAVNGVQVKDAHLFTGDQLAFDNNRFLIEAPGTPFRGAEVAPSSSTIVTPSEPKRAVEFTQTMRAIRPEAAQAQQAAPAAQSSAAPPHAAQPRAAAASAASAAAQQRAAAPAARQPALKTASRSPQPEPAKGFNPWWLLVAAALIATAIAYVLIGNR